MQIQPKWRVPGQFQRNPIFAYGLLICPRLTDKGTVTIVAIGKLNPEIQFGNITRKAPWYLISCSRIKRFFSFPWLLAYR